MGAFPGGFAGGHPARRGQHTVLAFGRDGLYCISYPHWRLKADSFTMFVKTGLEVLRHDGYKPLHGLRVGLFTNPSAVDGTLESTYSILCGANSVHMTALFAPEHGFSGAAAAGEPVSSYTDPVTGLPVYSLYGDQLRPTAEMLRDIDVIVCDVQDIGVRYFTYTWTISMLLEAAGEHNVTVVLLDRPNPLGGTRMVGPLVEPEYRSLVGGCPVPVRHGLTLGELTWMVNETWNPSLARLSIIACEHYEREMTWADTHLPWVPPSPNMPTLETVHQYPGACLVEGTNLSEGRGTSLPFQIVGAPWINAIDLAKHLNAQSWTEQFGMRFRPHRFRPTTSKWAGQDCGGVQVHITDPAHWQPIDVWLNVIAAIRDQYPDEFAWLMPTSEGGKVHFDRLIGSDRVRLSIEAGTPVADITRDWEASIAAFEESRKPFLLYE